MRLVSQLVSTKPVSSHIGLSDATLGTILVLALRLQFANRNRPSYPNVATRMSYNHYFEIQSHIRVGPSISIHF